MFDDGTATDDHDDDPADWNPPPSAPAPITPKTPSRAVTVAAQREPEPSWGDYIGAACRVALGAIEARQSLARKNAEASEREPEQRGCGTNDERVSQAEEERRAREQRRLEGEEQNERRYQEAVEQQERLRAEMYADDDEDDGEEAPHEWSDDNGRVWVDPAKCWGGQRRKVIEPDPPLASLLGFAVREPKLASPEKPAPPSPSRSPLASPNGGTSERTSSPARAGRVHELFAKARSKTKPMSDGGGRPEATGSL
jgi:hypothetical protein